MNNVHPRLHTTGQGFYFFNQVFFGRWGAYLFTRENPPLPLKTRKKVRNVFTWQLSAATNTSYQSFIECLNKKTSDKRKLIILQFQIFSRKLIFPIRILGTTTTILCFYGPVKSDVLRKTLDQTSLLKHCLNKCTPCWWQHIMFDYEVVTYGTQTGLLIVCFCRGGPLFLYDNPV